MEFKEWMEEVIMKTPDEVGRDLGVSGTAVRSWMNGTAGISLINRRTFKETYNKDPVIDFGVKASKAGRKKKNEQTKGS